MFNMLAVARGINDTFFQRFVFTKGEMFRNMFDADDIK